MYQAIDGFQRRKNGKQDADKGERPVGSIRFYDKRPHNESHLGMVRSMQHALSDTRLLISRPRRRFTWRLDLVERRGVLPRRGGIGRLQVIESNDSYVAR